MTDEAKEGWRCSTCWVQNTNGVRCVACDTPKEPAVYDGPPILFGGGPAAPVDVSMPTALITSRNSTLACNTPQATAQAPIAFCKAMTTPITRSELVFLIGCESSDLVDKTDCIGNLKVHPGRLMTWGSGECEQLPIRSDLTDEYHGVLKPLPIRAFADRSVKEIRCGSLTSYALRENNDVWSWGCPDNGPLGRPIKGINNEVWEEVGLPSGVSPHPSSGKVPERVWGLPTDDRIIKIVAGDSHAGVLTESGDVYMWGHYRDFTGPLGFWDGKKNVTTQTVPLKLTLPGVALDIASGENHTVMLVQCASAPDKRCLVVMGSNEFGQLCTVPSLPTLPPEVGGAASINIDVTKSILTPIEISPETYIDIRHQYLKPHVIPIEKLVFNRWRKKINVNDRIINEFEDMFVTANGETTPRKADLKITKVYAGSATTFVNVVDAGESMWFACGRGTYGELGGGFTEQAMYHLSLISMPTLCAFDSVVGGDFATFAVSSDGSVWAWGKGELCGLGPLAENKILIPKAIPGLRNKCHAVSCGMKTTYALTHEGFVFVWGEGNNYQLGLGTNEDVVSIPNRIPPEFFNNEAVVGIAAGANHAVCLINAVVERRGAKRTRMLDDADELPSLMKKSRTEAEPPVNSAFDCVGLADSHVNRPSLMFLPTAPHLSPTATKSRESDERQQAELSQTPKFFNLETLSGAAELADTEDGIPQGMSEVFKDYLKSVEGSGRAPAPLLEQIQRPTLMPHNEEHVGYPPVPPDGGEETDAEEFAADPMSESIQASELESSDDRDTPATDSMHEPPGHPELEMSVTEMGDPDGMRVPPGTVESSQKVSSQNKRTETPVQQKIEDSAAVSRSPISKPRDSLTAVLISADRPYDDTPKPSQGELEPERELEKAMAEESWGTEDAAAGEEPSSTTPKTKKARVKPKAKSKAKAKAKGRPGRKPKVTVEEEPAIPKQQPQEEESVPEETAPRRVASRRGRTTRTRAKDEDSVSSVIDSGDEEAEGPVVTSNGAKKTGTGRGRAKAKVRVVNKKRS